MNKRVYNKAVGKIFRTLGFLFILAVSLIVTAALIVNSGVSFLAFAEPMASQALALVPAVMLDYLGLGLLVGWLFLIWAIRRGVFLRVLVTVVLLVVFVLDTYNADAFFTLLPMSSPSWMDAVFNAIASPINQLLAISNWIPAGVSLLAVMLLWGVFANARPKRFSIFFIRVATITLFFGVVAFGLKANLTSAFVQATWFDLILGVCYILSFGLIAFGSAFGVIGFYRK